MSLGYVPCPMTAFQGIRKFRQGTLEVWTVDQSGKLKQVQVRQYWAPSAVTKEPIPSFDQAAVNVMDLLKESVNLHLRSDVPLGAFLSGGIDSSSVVALMRICGVKDIKTFSIGFDNEMYNELPYAEQVARHLKTEHYSHVITGTDAQELIPLIQTFDEPFADSSAIPTYLVSRLARQHVTVALSGDGGDELFAGYSQYARLERYRLLDWIPKSARRMVSRIGVRLISEKKRGGGFIRRLGVPVEQRLFSLVSSYLDGYLIQALSPSLKDFLSDETMDTTWQSGFWCKNLVTEAQVVDQRTYLADDILVKVDCSSMAVSLEARVPLLDHYLADYVNGLPPSYKLLNGRGKRLLKNIMEPYLPQDILYRPKKGFSIPLRSWLMGPLNSYVKGIFLDNPMSLFDPEGIRNMMEILKNSKRDLCSQIWKLISFGFWADQQRASKPF
jgi:asparagine synthase (glutamine-hydrolysing)